MWGMEKMWGKWDEVAPTCDISYLGAKAGGVRVPGQPGQLGETPSQDIKKLGKGILRSLSLLLASDPLPRAPLISQVPPHLSPKGQPG